jgi:dihydroneopterin aldolase
MKRHFIIVEVDSMDPVEVVAEEIQKRLNGRQHDIRLRDVTVRRPFSVHSNRMSHAEKQLRLMAEHPQMHVHRGLVDATTLEKI